jgi:LAGLIDADG endonuclease
MNKAKYIYLAGIIDGEGCITIGAGKKETCINYNALLLVQNTSEKLIDYLQSTFGGQKYLSKKETSTTRTAWMWRITKKAHIEQILLAVLPYLIIKREQAKILLNYVRLERTAPTELRKQAYEALRKLNSRGKSVTTNTQDSITIEMIESELHGDMQSDPVVTQEVIKP